MRISKKMIAACRDEGACREGLKWISAKPRTVEQLYDHNLTWFFWLRNILSPSARDAYYAAVNSARDAYNAAVEPARDAYGAAYDAAVKPARDAYYAAVKPALIKALRKTFA